MIICVIELFKIMSLLVKLLLKTADLEVKIDAVIGTPIGSWELSCLLMLYHILHCLCMSQLQGLCVCVYVQ